MDIRFATSKDMDVLMQYDKHVSEEEMENIIQQGRVYLAEDGGRFAGWLRYNLFWDNTPFLNMLYILEGYRGRGFGRKIIMYWEDEMKRKGYRTLMASTQADEYAQHFYFRLGYEAVGGFRLGDEPYEIIFSKKSVRI